VTSQEDPRIARRKEMENKLPYFTGTENWHQIYKKPEILATDGMIFVLQTAQAFWLADIVYSLQTKKEIREQPFQYYILTVNLETKKAVVRVEDGNEHELYRQEVDYSDFPLETFKFYFSDNVMLLPSEY
jgi:hypothetical protein